jgi:hypothetical protein
MTDENDILIDEEGNIRFVYSDLLDSVFVDDDRETKRASHVEPASSFGWEQDGWLADMKPSGGPLLYASKDERGVKHAFETRAEALAAEREWLRKHKGL